MMSIVTELDPAHLLVCIKQRIEFLTSMVDWLRKAEAGNERAQEDAARLADERQNLEAWFNILSKA
jgi:hypothetical protein